MARSIGTCGLTAPATLDAALRNRGRISRLSGSPRTRCATAQAKHVPRQPSVASPHAVSGQPTVLAKPAMSVMPVIEDRASCP